MFRRVLNSSRILSSSSSSSSSSSHQHRRFASILVIAEHDNKKLSAATLSSVSAGSKLGGDVVVLVAGKASNAVGAAAAKVKGVKKVLHVDDAQFEHALPENLAPLIVSLHKQLKFSHILASATTVGKNVAPRVAAALDVSQISEIVAIDSPDTFKRPIYAGNAIATVQSADATKVLTVRATAFEKAAIAASADAPIETVKPSAPASDKAKFASVELKTSDRPDLATAQRIVAGGRALKDAATFSKVLDPLAAKLNAAIGASRAAVDAGFCSNDLQIGQTGKIVAPQLYIAIGISGAIQHVAGMKDSKVIVSINKDDEAPIYALSDYWLVGDLFKLVPELESKL
jgi:electron transfer flavoprotein alpha subunit